MVLVNKFNLLDSLVFMQLIGPESGMAEILTHILFRAGKVAQVKEEVLYKTPVSFKCPFACSHLK